MSAGAVTTGLAGDRAAGDPAAPPLASRQRRAARRARSAVTLLAQGEPMLWLTGGGLVVAGAMIVGLVALIVWQGALTFWPAPVVSITTADGRTVWGEITRRDVFKPDPSLMGSLAPQARAAAGRELSASGGRLARRLVRSGNFELSGEHFTWVSDYEIAPDGEARPRWALVVERRSWGRFYGEPVAYLEDGKVVATDAAAVWRAVRSAQPAVLARVARQRDLERREMDRLNTRVEKARLAVRQAELDHGRDSAAWRQAVAAASRIETAMGQAFADLTDRIDALKRENERSVVRLRTGDGREADLALGDIVRAYPANQLDGAAKWGVYLSRWREFLADEPREANSEGGVFPAIFGTIVMTLVMSALVVPFGVLAALYLREYAKTGPLVAAVRISINNLAGVPSIVFGVVGLGFFCYLAGGAIDQAFFAARLPNPTYGTGGLLWASLTLALLTLPVVIVATEEALAAVPGSLREGSYACGASKWQTIQRIVLPRALPGIMTGAILAMARGAGEVAPLMLVGAVKLAPELPLDGVAPFLHPERSFMHLGFHIYDLGFQSQNSEAAKPMVFTTTLLLVAIITGLNLAAIWLRARLRRRFAAGHF
ncbi:MAG TPA: phosphate ABC transporter permease PstA [Candidatus Krumholzibacteria bacterium]|nr:phosphate ABC transporter permease PstA [Candidatus Krumholzibacteria bacterium]HPD70487.1 phosphate ABC transporter permease PstA [Candidatus Krumholzibacteria bacterium]HRY39813.1 phosphate ABC transporter permease PstA [Candidatus Krumholzibacteria bacterium]